MNNFLSVASGLGIRIITQQLFFAGTSVSNHLQAIKDSQVYFFSFFIIILYYTFFILIYYYYYYMYIMY